MNLENTWKNTKITWKNYYPMEKANFYQNRPKRIYNLNKVLKIIFVGFILYIINIYKKQVFIELCPVAVLQSTGVEHFGISTI